MSKQRDDAVFAAAARPCNERRRRRDRHPDRTRRRGRRAPSSRPWRRGWLRSSSRRASSVTQLLALFAQMRRHLLVDILEHRGRAAFRSLVQRAKTAAPRGRDADLLVEFGLQLDVTLLAPCAKPNQMILQPLDGIAERPCRLIVFAADISTDRRSSNAARRDRSPIRSASARDSGGPAPPPSKPPHGPPDSRCHRRAAQECRSHARGPQRSRFRRRQRTELSRSPIDC